MADLATIGEPISNTFVYFKDLAPGEVEKYKLSDEQIKFFEENGYVSGIPCLNDEQVEKLRQELEIIMRGDEHVKVSK